MLKQAAMQRIGYPAIVSLTVAFVFGAGSGAARAQPSASISATQPAPVLQVQARRKRPKVRVQPRYPYRNFHSAYPLPYDNEYPGPNAVRQCTDWYATEYRPSGTVIVPKTRCWWVRG